MRTGIAFIAALSTFVLVAGSTLAQDADTQQQITAARAANEASNYVEAARLWTPLANSGLAEAQYQLGLDYLFGHGVCRNMVTGADWILKASAQGYTDAETQAGRIYYYGEGVAKDRSAAIEWLTKAAVKGSSEAEEMLGDLYGTGVPGTEDYKQAAYWYQKAADQGNPGAEEGLGRLYSHGLGVVQNYKKAAMYYQKAADEGSGKAMYELGRMYENGQGVPKDYVQAYKWYALGLSSHNFWISDGGDTLNALQAKMTPAELEQAKKLIHEAGGEVPDGPGALAIAPVRKDACY